jgi:hypothetical protein
MKEKGSPADALAAALGLRPVDPSGAREPDEKWVVHELVAMERRWDEHLPDIAAIFVALIRKELPVAEAKARMRVVLQAIHEEARREEDRSSGSDQ